MRSARRDFLRPLIRAAHPEKRALHDNRIESAYHATEASMARHTATTERSQYLPAMAGGVTALSVQLMLDYSDAYLQLFCRLEDRLAKAHLTHDTRSTPSFAMATSALSTASSTTAQSRSLERHLRGARGEEVNRVIGAALGLDHGVLPRSDVQRAVVEMLTTREGASDYVICAPTGGGKTSIFPSLYL